MDNRVKLTEKYERNGWPSIKRPDLKNPDGWTIPLITSIERIRCHALSPDGSAVVYIKDSDSSSDVYMLPLNEVWPSRISLDRPMVPNWDDEIPVWSPDSKWIAFCIHGHVHIVPREGGLPKKITGCMTSASSPRFLPDSHRLVVTVERDGVDQLLLTDIEGCWPRPLTSDTLGDHWDARPSPDGRSILYILRHFDNLNRLEVTLYELETGKSITLYGKDSVRAFSPKWSPDGNWISFIAQETEHDELYLIRPNGANLHQLTSAGEDITAYDWSPDGKRIAATVNRGGAHALILIETETSSIEDLRSGLGIHSNPNWSHDGRFITFEYESSILPPDLYKMDVASRQVTQMTFSKPLAMQNNKMVMPEIVSYKSHDGLEIPAFLFCPQRSNGAAIVYPHGGPNAQYGYEWDELAQYFTAKGYTYLCPNYRGTTGYGKTFERANYNAWGVGDTQDCLYAARYLHGFKEIRQDAIGIGGGSYGGYLTINCLSRDSEYLYACGVSKYGDANVVSSWAQCEKRLRLYTEIYLGHPSINNSIYKNASPLHNVKNVQKPMLILHGLLDTIVPPEASEEWVEALKRNDKIFEYKTYAIEPHGFLHRENLMDAYERIETFFDWYLLPR